jgi:hypothetical protein
VSIVGGARIMFKLKDIENRPDHSIRIEGTDVEISAYPLLSATDDGKSLIIRVEKGGRTIFESKLIDVLIERGSSFSTRP